MAGDLRATQPPDLVERLKRQARDVSDCSKRMQQAKQDRNRAAGDVDASYVGLEPGQTLEWKAAEEIETLRSLLLNEQRCHSNTRTQAAEALRRSRREALEEAARVAEETPVPHDIGSGKLGVWNDACFAIAAEIRALISKETQ